MDEKNSAMCKYALLPLFLAIVLGLVGGLFGGGNTYIFVIVSTVLSVVSLAIFLLIHRGGSKMLLILGGVVCLGVLLGLGVQLIL